MISIEVFSIPIPFITAKAFLCLYYLNFSFPALAVFGLNFTDDLKNNKIYSVGISFSVFLRTLFWIGETYEYNDKHFLLTVCFFIMSIFFIFEKLIKRKLNDIERNII